MNPSPFDFTIVLVSPEIPGNTGTIGRTCLGLNARLVLIHPLGFSLEEKALRRAGLDYWKHLSVLEYSSFEKFLEEENPNPEQLHFFSKRGQHLYFDLSYKEGNYYIFGSETSGLPTSITESFSQESFFRLPCFSDLVRSYNLSNAVSAVSFEHVRQKLFFSKGD